MKTTTAIDARRGEVMSTTMVRERCERAWGAFVLLAPRAVLRCAYALAAVTLPRSMSAAPLVYLYGMSPRQRRVAVIAHVVRHHSGAG